MAKASLYWCCGDDFKSSVQQRSFPGRRQGISRQLGSNHTIHRNGGVPQAAMHVCVGWRDRNPGLTWASISSSSVATMGQAGRAGTGRAPQHTQPVRQEGQKRVGVPVTKRSGHAHAEPLPSHHPTQNPHLIRPQSRHPRTPETVAQARALPCEAHAWPGFVCFSAFCLR
ncbi:hypothetical protein BKA81DRAFT_47739 [Phyllosticta paracitricarpa]